MNQKILTDEKFNNNSIRKKQRDPPILYQDNVKCSTPTLYSVNCSDATWSAICRHAPYCSVLCRMSCNRKHSRGIVSCRNDSSCCFLPESESSYKIMEDLPYFTFIKHIFSSKYIHWYYGLHNFHGWLI